MLRIININVEKSDAWFQVLNIFLLFQYFVFTQKSSSIRFHLNCKQKNAKKYDFTKKNRFHSYPYLLNPLMKTFYKCLTEEKKCWIFFYFNILISSKQIDAEKRDEHSNYAWMIRLQKLDKKIFFRFANSKEPHKMVQVTRNNKTSTTFH